MQSACKHKGRRGEGAGGGRQQTSLELENIKLSIFAHWCAACLTLRCVQNTHFPVKAFKFPSVSAAYGAFYLNVGQICGGPLVAAGGTARFVPRDGRLLALICLQFKARVDWFPGEYC